MNDTSVLFEPGFSVCTPGAMRALTLAQVSGQALIDRHVRGDFGEVDEEDHVRNLAAIEGKDRRVLSSYRLQTQAVVWVITEADRSATTLLLPSEY